MTDRVQPEKLITPNLAPEEEPRWIGYPSLKATIQQNALALAFGLTFVTAPWFSKPISTLTIILSSLFGLVWIARALAEITASGRTAYAITDRRILIVRGLQGSRVQSWLPESINVTEKKVRKDGSGSLYFRAEKVNGLEAGGIHKIGFHGVHNVEVAYDALTRLAGSKTDMRNS